MMPQMQATIFGLEETMQFQIVVKSVNGADIAESSKTPQNVPLWFEGSLQPLHPRELLVKPEGQRAWKWWTLFTDLELQKDWVITDIDGIKYRVMSSSDWRNAGFRQYQLIEGPSL